MNRRVGQLRALLRRRIAFLDGALGTSVQALQLSEADFRGERFADWPQDLMGNNDLLSITQPARVARIHHEFLEAGADIVTTNTFNANAPSQGEYGLEERVVDINLAAARLAREAADRVAEKPVFRGLSPAPWAPPIAPRRSPPMSTIPATARSNSTNWPTLTPPLPPR